MIYVFLADGFEEIEALGSVDILRRAGLSVQTVGVGTTAVTGSHGIVVKSDIAEQNVRLDAIDAVVLPGGMPGTRNLEQSAMVQEAIAAALKAKKIVAAICAAPSILGHGGYLTGHKATCYPGFEESLDIALPMPVVTDGLFTTGRGPGVTVDFALELVKRLVSAEASEQIRRSMQCP